MPRKKKKSKGKGKGKSKAKAKTVFDVEDIGYSEPETQVGRNEKPAKKSHKIFYFDLQILAKRPDYGSRGRKISLSVNYFPLELPRGDIFQYDVDITVRKAASEKCVLTGGQPWRNKFLHLTTMKNREIIGMLRQHSKFDGHFPAYDGKKNLYTRKPLQETPLNELVEIANRRIRFPTDVHLARGDTYSVSIKPVLKGSTHNNVIDLNMLHALYDSTVDGISQEAITAIGTILRSGPCFQQIPLKRSFFNPLKEIESVYPLSGSKEICFGYRQSLILTELQPVVNINVSTTAFWKSEQLIDFVCEILKCSKKELASTLQLRLYDIIQLSRKLKDVRITTTHLSHESDCRVLRLTECPAESLKFTVITDKGRKEISVSDYFSEKYGIKLQYPHLPCVQIQPQENMIYLPLEICKIASGQHSNDRLTEKQTRDMTQVASLTPEARFRKIKQVWDHAQFNRDPCNAQFGIKVSPNPLSVEGRIIESPNIMYSDYRRVKPKDGIWEMKSYKFFRGAKVDSWVILSFVNERFCTVFHLRKFGDMLRTVGFDCGLMLGRLEFVGIFSGRDVQVARELEAIQLRFKDVKFAIVVLQGKNSDVYGEIKYVCESRLALTTQCTLASTVVKLNRSVVRNICLKINVKMGGVNFCLTPSEKPAIFNRPILIIGAHVAQNSCVCYCPSVAAVVGSLDEFPFRYAVALRAQGYNRCFIEQILDLKSMIMELLRDFYRETGGKKPEKIIFYRSGVGESRFAMVQCHDLHALRDACRSMAIDYNPAITIVVVQKRHHTRFIPQDSGDGVGPGGNVPPGTVIDRGVSGIKRFDFFLCSHLGHQGTSRPTHYTVIYDDNEFTSDDIQKLTYYLCNTYARCTKSISIPAPLAYAQLASCHAKRYKTPESKNNSWDMTDAEIPTLENWMEQITILPEMRNTMYFV